MPRRGCRNVAGDWVIGVDPRCGSRVNAVQARSHSEERQQSVVDAGCSAFPGWSQDCQQRSSSRDVRPQSKHVERIKRQITRANENDQVVGSQIGRSEVVLPHHVCREPERLQYLLP